MPIIETLKNNIIETFASISLLQAIRLVAIVGGYILIRNLVTRELAKRQLEEKVRADERRLQKERTEKLVEKPDELDGGDSGDKATGSTTEFGWGKKTRRRVKKQKEMFERAVDQLKQQQQQGLGSSYNSDEDADIQDLLED